MRRLAVVLGVLCLAPVVYAAVLIPIDFDALVTTSPVIVRGTIGDMRSDWVDGRRAVQTYVTLEALEYIKGDLGARVTFVVPGGDIGRYRTIFVGAPQFQSGEEVTLFLQTAGSTLPHIVGLNQGVVRVAFDDRSGRRLAYLAPSVAKIDRTMPLDSFESSVRQVLRDRSRR
jgi:hypothetical protein